MKNIFSILGKSAVAAVLVAGGMQLTSCTNLDEDARTFLNQNNFYKTEADFQGALNNTYYMARLTISDRRSTYLPLEFLTESAEPNYRKEQPYLDNMNLWNDVNNVSYTFNNIWKNAYATINDANIVIGRLAESSSVTGQVADRLRGQALFLRAYSYYMLVRIYGGCPIRTSYTSGLDGAEAPRNTADEVWAQIFSDLEEAASLLPQKGTSGYEDWRVSQGACYALLGDAYLYKATVQSTDSERGGNKEELQKSMEYSKKVMDSGKYSLVPDYKNLWFYFNKNCKNGPESVFEFQFAHQDKQGWDIGVDGGLGNNTSMTDANGNIFMGTYYNRGNASLYLYNMYDPADKRREALVTDFYCKVSGNLRHYVYDFDAEQFAVDKSWGSFDDTKSTNQNDPYWMPEGYAYHNLLFAKWLDNDTEAAKVNNTRCAINYTFLRYADVLLNYAEAANLLNAGQGLEQLNMVHQRAGLPALAAMGQKEMDDAIIQERILEFAGEAKNYFTELRKGVLGDRVEEFLHVNYLKYKADKKITDSPNSRDHLRFSKEMQFIPKKSFLWKIPQTNVDANKLLEQNPDNQSLRAPKYN